ncbi:MAG: GNAT family N-acetyltransferase [Leptotrichiaceae bacterium]|nr:GNAT family N-acetyltransferase [Leptotrichiaceae bacterium]
MEKIVIEEVKGQDIDICRELCNELMKYQQSKAFIAKEAFDLMNFDTRMKKSYERSPISQVLVAKDGEIPVGYIFSTVDAILEPMKKFPDWAPNKEVPGVKGFYPDWLQYPIKIGCISNFYLKESYRGSGIGKELFEKSMKWLKSFNEVNYIFAYISNGNDSALDFYLKNGFKYSHEVFDGFIKTTYFSR